MTTLIESVNPIHLDLLVEKYPALLESGLDLQMKKVEGENYYNALLGTLTKYRNGLNLVSDEVATRPVEYIPGKNHPKDSPPGRMYPKKAMGLAMFPRFIRDYLLSHTKTKGYQPLVVDIDIKNCNPSLYYQWVLQEGYPPEKFVVFKDYIDHRDEWKKELGKNIKTQVLSVLNCNEKLEFAPESEKFEKLVREIWDSHDFLKAKFNLTPLNDLKSFIYRRNTTIERQIIDLAMQFIQSETNMSVSVYAFDGFCVARQNAFENPESIQSILTQLNAHIHLQTGFKVEFVEKPIELDQKFVDMIESSNLTVGKLENAIDLVLQPNEKVGMVLQDNVFEYPEDIIVFKCAMADGKTYKIYTDIKAIRKQRDITTISILNRIALIESLAKKDDYSDTVFSYRDDDEKGEIEGIHRSVIICGESLHRLTSRTLVKCDYLILDELMSLLPSLLTEQTHRENLQINQRYFFGLIRSCKKIIICDANINQETIDFIKRIRNTDATVRSFVIPPRYPKLIKMYDDEGQMIESLKSAVKEGKKLFICSTRTIDFGLGILQILSECAPIGAPLKTMYINSETKDLYKVYVDNSNRWNEFDVVMISPTITSGVSCEVRDYFDEIYCFFTNQTTNALDASQQIGRVRYPKTNVIHIATKIQRHPQYHSVVNREKVIRMLYQNTDELYTKNRTMIETKFNYKHFKEELLMSHTTELFIHNCVSQSKHYSMYEYYLKKSLENSYICEFLTISEKNSANNQLVVETTTPLKNERAKNMFLAPNMTVEEANNLTLEEQEGNLSFKKFKLSQRTCLSYAQLEKLLHLNKDLENPYKTTLHHLDTNVIPTVKILKMILRNFASPECVVPIISPESGILNPLELSSESEDEPLDTSLFRNIQFDLDSKTDFTRLTSSEMKQMYQAPLLKVLYCQDMMKECFQHTHLYSQLSLTDEAFENGFKRFEKFYTTHKRRLYELFGLPPLEKLSEMKTSDKRDKVLNKILASSGLVFKPLGSSRKMVNGKKTTVNDGLFLTLKIPVCIFESLPIELEHTSGSTKKVIMDKECLPILNEKRVFSHPDALDQYKKSVFFKMYY